jgi:hypothetical protein
MGWAVNATPRLIYPRERPGTLCIGGWVDPRVSLDSCGKSRPHRYSIPGPSKPIAQSLYRLSYPSPPYSDQTFKEVSNTQSVTLGVMEEMLYKC